MERHMSAAEVQTHFDEVMKYVSEQQEPVMVECDGEVIAVIISVEAYEELKLLKIKQPLTHRAT